MGCQTFVNHAFEVHLDKVEVWLCFSKFVFGQRVDEVVVSDAIGKSGIDELLRKSKIYFIALATNRRTEAGKYVSRDGTFIDKHINGIINDAVDCSFPPGMYGGDSLNVIGIKQYRYAVGSANSDSNVRRVGNQCVSVRKNR